MQRLTGGSRAPVGWWDEVVRTAGDLLPAYPVLDAAQVPPPPMLDLEMPAADVIKQLDRAYVCAYRHSYGAVPSPAKRRVVDPRKLIKIAVALDEARVRPVAWVISRIDFYEKYAGSARSAGGPALGWVYSAKAVAERMDWYSLHAATHMGGRVLLADEHRALLERYQSMKRALYRIAAREGRTPTRAEVARAVRDTLPADVYSDLSAKVRDKTRKTNRQLEQRIERGEYVW